jgi:hypothetical protein
MARFGQGPRSCFYSVGSFCRYPTFLLARPSTRCLVLALDAPGLTRRPNKRPAKWAPVRMLLRSLAHYTVLHVKPLAARAAMVNSPGPQLAGHRSVTKRASVNIFFGCHLAILDIKLVTAHASMVNLPTRQLTGNSALAKRARVNKIFGSDMSVFDLKSVSAHIAVIYLARAHGAAHSNLTEWANVLEWLCCSLLPKLLSWMWLHLHRAGRLRCSCARKALHFLSCVASPSSLRLRAISATTSAMTLSCFWRATLTCVAATRATAFLTTFSPALALGSYRIPVDHSGRDAVMSIVESKLSLS